MMLLVGRFVVCSKGGRGREADKGGAAMWPRCLSARARPNSLLLLCLDLARPYRRRAASPRPQDSPGAAVSPPGSSGPFGALLGEFSCFPCFDRLLMRSDAPDNFFGRPLASPSRLGIPDACASLSVSFPSQLVTDILSPSSSTLEGMFGRCMGLSGGGGGPGGLSGTSFTIPSWC